MIKEGGIKMKNKLLLSFIFTMVIALCIAINPMKVHASDYVTVNENVSGYGTTITAFSFYVKYGNQPGPVFAKVMLDANTDAQYRINLIGSTNNDVFYRLKEITKRSFYGGHSNIYFLPRSGMNCPSDKTYCIGVGKNLTGKYLLQGGDCGGQDCAMLGIEIVNESNSTLNISGAVFYGDE